RFDRVRRLVGNPIGAVRRRMAPGGVAAIRWRATISGIIEAIDGTNDVAGYLATGDCEILCLDAIDHAGAEGVSPSRRLPIAPGGLLWLADRYVSTEEIGPGSLPSREPVASPASRGCSSPVTERSSSALTPTTSSAAPARSCA